MRNRTHRAAGLVALTALVLAMLPVNTSAQSANIAGSPVCDGEGVTYNPGNGEDIALPAGYSVSVFARDLNFPTGIAFTGGASDFQAYVIEAGTGLPGRCNNNEGISNVDKFAKNNPFTPDLLVLDKNGHVTSGPLAKPTSDGGGFQPDGPAIGLAFENGTAGGRLFASDSNQGIRGAPGRGNNTSRILQVDPNSGAVQVLIPSLPTGDHPTENIIVKDKWIYWAQGSATNAGVTGHDNGAGGNQHDIACQDVVLSQNVWDSGDGHTTSGYSNHGVARPGSTFSAFEDADNGMHACTGATLRAPVDAPNIAASAHTFS